MCACVKKTRALKEKAVWVASDKPTIIIFTMWFWSFVKNKQTTLSFGNRDKSSIVQSSVTWSSPVWWMGKQDGLCSWVSHSTLPLTKCLQGQMRLKFFPSVAGTHGRFSGSSTTTFNFESQWGGWSLDSLVNLHRTSKRKALLGMVSLSYLTNTCQSLFLTKGACLQLRAFSRNNT